MPYPTRGLPLCRGTAEGPVLFTRAKADHSGRHYALGYAGGGGCYGLGADDADPLLTRTHA